MLSLSYILAAVFVTAVAAFVLFANLLGDRALERYSLSLMGLTALLGVGAVALTALG